MKYTNLLESYLDGIKLLESCIASLDEKDYGYRPNRPDAWTIHEHLIHIADTETNGFIRIKSIIAQPNSECYVMDEEQWTKNLKPKKEDVKKYLQLFNLLRTIVYELIKDEPEENWSKNYFIRQYKDRTAKLTLEQAIEMYSKHLHTHVEYIKAIKTEIK